MSTNRVPRDLSTSVYNLGRDRGAETGRRSPDDRDWEWLAAKGEWSLEGLSDPQTGVDFEAGMADGAGDDDLSDE